MDKGSERPAAILLVEDEAIIALAERRILERNGYRVEVAVSGEKAIERVESGAGIDLILMDIDLGEGMDGTRAAERILAERHLPLIFLSSHIEPEVVEKTEGITSYGYIVKNSGETVLLAAIKMAFKLFMANVDILAANEILKETQTALIERKQALQLSESQFKSLFTHLNSSLSLYQVEPAASARDGARDGAGAADYRFLLVNPEYERSSGRKAEEVLGATLLSVYPKTEASWLETLKTVSATGEPARIEGYSAELKQYVELIVYVPQPGQVALLGSDISERKLAEEKIKNQLDELNRWHAATLGREDRVLQLKREANELLARLGEAPRYASVLEDSHE
jgi:CheY-like chemotaxis protein